MFAKRKPKELIRLDAHVSMLGNEFFVYEWRSSGDAKN